MKFKRLFIYRIHFFTIIILQVFLVIILEILNVTGICIFKIITGYPCPFCGLTRSFEALMRGELETSFYYSFITTPLLVMFATILVYFMSSDKIQVFSGKRKIIVLLIVILIQWLTKLLFIDKYYW